MQSYDRLGLRATRERQYGPSFATSVRGHSETLRGWPARHGITTNSNSVRLGILASSSGHRGAGRSRRPLGTTPASGRCLRGRLDAAPLPPSGSMDPARGRTTGRTGAAPPSAGLSREAACTWSGPTRRTEDVTWSPGRRRLSGPGAATPAVANGRIFLSAVDRKNADLLALCLDRESGAVLWQQRGGHRRGSPAEPALPHRKGQYSGSAVAGPRRRDCLLPLRHRRSRRVRLRGPGTLEAQPCRGVGRARVQENGYASSPLLFDGTLYLQLLHRAKSYLRKRSAGAGASSILAGRPTCRRSAARSPAPTV